MAVVDVDAVPGTGSARRRLLRIGIRLALTAGFVVAGWVLFGLAASAASASVLPQASATSPSDSTDGGGLLGGLLGNTVGTLGNTVDNLTGTVNTTVDSVLGTVNTTLNSTLGTVGATVNSVTTTVGTTVVAPTVTTVTTVTKTVAPVVSPLLPVKSTPSTPASAPTAPAATNPLSAQPSPAPAAAPVVKPAHHATAKSVAVSTTRPVEQLRPATPPLPKTPQPAPQQPLAPAPTVSTGHGPNGGNRHAISAITANASGSALALRTTVASHPIIVPGEMPGLPSVSPD